MSQHTLPAEAAGFVTLNGRELPRIGYGLGGLATAVGGGRVTYDDGVALLRHALGRGVRVYDTAQFYGRGNANRMLADAFDGRRDEVVYVTKAGTRIADDGPFPITAAQRPEELRAAVEDNLRTLRTDHLDAVYLRRMDMAPGLIATEPEQRIPLDDQLAALVELREAGLIGGIGLSHVTLDQVTSALPAGIVAISNIYHLLDRSDEDVVALAQQHGIIWAPYFPLGRGGYTKLPSVTDNDEVRRIAAELGATPTQVGLAWLLAHSPQSLVIAGTSSREHLDENVGAAAVRLSDAHLARLDAQS